MTTTDTEKLAQAETLARIYVDALAVAEGVSTTKMTRRQDSSMEEFLASMSSDASDDGHRLRADLTLAAILTAKAIAAEPNLAGRLRRGEDTAVVLETHTQEWVDLVEAIVTSCATHKASSKKTVIANDGTERAHTPQKGNDTVQRALTRGWPIVGIAPDPKRHLPSSLLRTAEYRLTLPPIDGWAVRLLIEAMTGSSFAGAIDETVVRTADIGDFSLAFRQGHTAEQSLARLAGLVSNKATSSGEGPTLESLSGYGEAAVWGQELVADLTDYRANRLEWDLIANRSLLLSGAPGLGKTAFARALAKSLGVHLVTTSVADWNANTYLSGTLQAMRSAFHEAKRNSPAVLFIDELDGISSRDRISGDYVEYWTQIVNLLLELMSNAAELEGVIIVAATNHPENIDRAILRAGRIDRHIILQRPSPGDLAKIFRFYVGADALEGEDLMPAALAARGGTGADVEAWVRRAKAAARRARRKVSMGDLLTQIRGRISDLPPETHWRVAVHEAGHVVAARALDIGRVIGVSIVTEGGLVEMAGDPGRDADEALIDNSIAFLLAGRAAEILVLGTPGTGSGGTRSDSDLARATELAQMAETIFGYGSLGLVHVPTSKVSDMTRYPGLLPAVRERLDRGLARAQDLLSRHRTELDSLAKALNMRGYLSADDVITIAEGVTNEVNPPSSRRVTRKKKAA